MYDYEDYYNEPTAVEFIIAEAAEKCKALIRDEVQHDVQKALEENQELRQEVADLKDKLRVEKWTFENALKQKDAEYKTAIGSAIDEVIRTSLLDVGIGGTMFFVDRNPKLILCPCCEGIKEITINGHTFCCPKCRGYNNGMIQSGFQYSCVSGIVTDIRIDREKNVHLDFKTQGNKTARTVYGKNFFEASFDDDKNWERWKKTEVFRTEEECQKRVNELNVEGK